MPIPMITSERAEAVTRSALKRADRGETSHKRGFKIIRIRSQYVVMKSEDGVWEQGADSIGQEKLPNGMRAILDDPQFMRNAIEEIASETCKADQGVRPLRGLVYRLVDEMEAQQISKATGIDMLAGFRHTIDNYAIEHALKKHGNPLFEAKRGQIALTIDDFTKIPEITTPANIDSTANNERGMPIVLYKKRYNGVIYVVEEVRKGRKQLAFVSMRKLKGGSETSGERLSPKMTTSHTPETLRRSEPPSDPSIAPGENGVNGVD